MLRFPSPHWILQRPLEMDGLTKEQIEKVYWHWLFEHYDHRGVDDLALPFLNQTIEPEIKWLKLVRKALFLSSAKMAENLGMSAAGYLALEASEALGTISVRSLTKAAEAMDCELVYAIRPKGKLPFSKVIWRQLLEEVSNHTQVKHRPEGQKVRILVGLAGARMKSPSVRRKLGWAMW